MCVCVCVCVCLVSVHGQHDEHMPRTYTHLYSPLYFFCRPAFPGLQQRKKRKNKKYQNNKTKSKEKRLYAGKHLKMEYFNMQYKYTVNRTQK